MTCAPRPSRRRRGITTRAPALFVMIFCGALLAGHQGETSSELHGRGLTPALQGQPGLLHKSLRLRGGKVEAKARLPELSVCDHTEGGVYIDPRAVAPEISELRAPKRSRSPLEPRESGRSPSAFSAARVKDDDAEGEEVTSSSDLVRKRSASGSPTVRAPSPRPNTALHRLRGNYGQTCAPPHPTSLHASRLCQKAPSMEPVWLGMDFLDQDYYGRSRPGQPRQPARPRECPRRGPAGARSPHGAALTARGRQGACRKTSNSCAWGLRGTATATARA